MDIVKIFLLIFINLVSFHLRSTDINFTIDPRSLLVFSEDGKAPLLKPAIGKKVVESLMNTSEEKFKRLENKRVVTDDDVIDIVTFLETIGYPLINREVKEIPEGAQAGTFTFYGTAVKFIESKLLPKTSIKLRIRIYITEEDGKTTRAHLTSKSAFLEIKIKNPMPEYELSVHKYRIMMPDKDILMLITSNPANQEKFFDVINKLAERAHFRDPGAENQNLIDVMFEQIKIIAIAEPGFIKPSIGITYHRISKKYDEEYEAVVKKGRKLKNCFQKEKKTEKKTRRYEITIDSNLKAFHVYFSDNKKAINIDKYFENGGSNNLLIAKYPENARVVEFKQPDAIGYQGKGKIRGPDAMEGAQKELWLAFVYELGRRALPRTTIDSGKFFHVKQFMRIEQGRGKDGEQTLLFHP